MPTLVLGSTSVYRRALLARLRLPFEIDTPQVDETPQAGEAPAALAARLALAKALDVARRWPHAIVIGSDQVAELDGLPMGKPGGPERAAAQLRAMSGRMTVFHSAVAVVRLDQHVQAQATAVVRVHLRTLSDKEIHRYLQLEQPYDCAGSAKCETLGIALAEAIESDDPTALEGLPLVLTCRLLRIAGLDPVACAR